MNKKCILYTFFSDCCRLKHIKGWELLAFDEPMVIFHKVVFIIRFHSIILWACIIHYYFFYQYDNRSIFFFVQIVLWMSWERSLIWLARIIMGSIEYHRHVVTGVRAHADSQDARTHWRKDAFTIFGSIVSYVIKGMRTQLTWYVIIWKQCI